MRKPNLKKRSLFYHRGKSTTRQVRVKDRMWADFSWWCVEVKGFTPSEAIRQLIEQVLMDPKIKSLLKKRKAVVPQLQRDSVIKEETMRVTEITEDDLRTHQSALVKR